MEKFSRCLESFVRRDEPVYRYDGEEFIILLHAGTDQMAIDGAERLRNTIANTVFVVGEHELNITFTSGLTKTNRSDSLRESIARADSALYTGKKSGRNCTVYACPERGEIVIRNKLSFAI